MTNSLGGADERERCKEAEMRFSQRTMAGGLLTLACIFGFVAQAAAQGVVFSQTDYGVLSAPSSVIAADFNGDGKLDLAVANSGSNSVSILLGAGDGTFGARTEFATGQGPRCVAAGDFNGDNKLDLVTANSLANTISVLPGDGDGTFSPRTDFPTDSNPVFVATGLFNPDGALDLAVVNKNGDTISVLLGNGNGTFGVRTDFVTGAQPQWLIVSDFNGDGKPDLASANPGSHTVSVLLGNGDGTFAAKVDFATGMFPRSLVAADFRRIMKLDLATANTDDSTLSVLLGRGDGTFDPRTDLGTDTGPIAIASADFDNDGKPDLLTGNFGFSSTYYSYLYFYPTVSLLRGNGDGTFAARADFGIGFSLSPDPMSIATGDFNGDGRIDAAVVRENSQAVSVLLQVPAISFSTGELSFPTNQAAGTASPPQTLTVSSTGSLDLVIGAVSIVGINPGDFSKVADTCSGMAIPSGSSCEVQVTFTPSTSGFREANLRIPNNAPGSPHDVRLTGRGAGKGAVSPSPASLAFGDQSIGSASASRQITLTNTGTGPLTLLNIFVDGDTAFRFVGNNCPDPLAASASCTLNVDFLPLTLGMHSASLRIDSDTLGSPNFVALTGNGVPPPAYSLSATALDFGSQRVGTTSAPQVVTLTNTGTVALTITQIALDDDFTGHAFEFSLQHNCPVTPATLAVSASCTISVAYSPTFDDFADAWVQISSDASGSPRRINLQGVGVVPFVGLSAGSLVFSGQLVGTPSSAQTITLTNFGGAELAITSIGVAGANSGDFAATHNCPLSPTTLAAGAGCEVNVTFTPSAVGMRSASLSVSSDAAGSPHTAALSGTGTAPAVMLNPASLAFGNQIIGTSSAAQSVTLTNSGTATLDISNVSLAGTDAGQFMLMHNCPASLAPAASCALSITFAPTGPGTKAASVRVESSAASSPDSAALSGTGVTPPSVVPAPTSLSFAAQLVGTTSAAQTITLTNGGGSPLTITSVLLTGANAAEFLQTNNCPISPATLAAGANCVVTITFGPTTQGAKSAEVSITSDAPGSPHSAMLSGTATLPPANVALAPASLTYAAQLVGTTSAAQAITLTNSGGSPLTIASIVLAGANAAEFLQTNNCPISPATLAAGGNCVITITFGPATPGAKSAVVSITSDAPGSPHTAMLNGTGITPPSVVLAPTSLSFAAQLVGTTSAAQTITLTNGGGSTLNISGMVLGGANATDFTRSDNCGGSVNAGANCTITITFRPGAIGMRLATITITDNAAGSPRQVNLSGSGMDFAIQPATGSPSQVTIDAGQTASFQLSLTASGGFSGMATVTCTATIPAGMCAVSSGSVTFSETAPASVTVSITTTARGMFAPRGWPQVPPALPIPMWLLALALSVLAGLRWNGGGAEKSRLRLAQCVPVVALLLAVLLSAACSGGNAAPPMGTPAGTYPVTVTVTAGGASRTTMLSVTVR
jgi:hypothetical protein